jgi:hypothetical protein
MEQHEIKGKEVDFETHAISIWFFIGIILDVYGALIVGAGIYGLIVPPAHLVVLNELHFSLWWGVCLLAAGVVYTIKFFPTKKRI